MAIPFGNQAPALLFPLPTRPIEQRTETMEFDVKRPPGELQRLGTRRAG